MSPLLEFYLTAYFFSSFQIFLSIFLAFLIIKPGAIQWKMKGLKLEPYGTQAVFIHLVTCSSFFFQTSFSQTVIDPRILSSASRVEKMVHLDSVIRFTAKEARLFWPIYNQYMWRWEKLMGDRINFIQNNIEEQEDAHPRKKELMRKLFKNDMALTKLQKKYYSRFRKALSPPKANKFMQIEYETQNRIRIMEQSIYFL